MVNTEHGWRGGEQFLALLLAHLPAEVETITACLPDAPLARCLVDRGHAVVPLQARGSWDLHAALAIRYAARNLACDLVHAHTSRAHMLGLLAQLGNGSAPLVVTRHLDFDISWASRWKYRAARRIAAVSGRVRDVLVNGGIDAADVDVVHNGIDLAPFANQSAKGVERSRLRQELGIPDSDLIMTSVGQLTQQKNPLLLLNAWRDLAVGHADAWLLLVGGGDLEPEIRRRAAEIPRVCIAGFRKDVPRILLASDVFVLTSDNEGLPLSVMEAMASGLPVVATRAGGTGEVVNDGVEGLLMAVGDGAGVRRALERMLTDAVFRRQAGYAAHRRAHAEFGASRMAVAYLEFYHRSLSAPH